MQPRTGRIVFFLFFFLSNFLHAQDKKRLHESLAALATAKTDSDRVNYLDNIGWDTSYENLAAGLKYCQEGLDLAEKIKYDRGIIRTCNSIGTIYQDMGDANKALTFQLRGLELAEKTNSKAALGRACLNVSIVYISQSDYKKALEYLLRAKAIYEELNEGNGLSAVYSDLGAVYLDFPDSTRKAVEYFNKAMQLGLSIHKTSEVANSLAGLGRCYQQLGDTIASDKAMNRAIVIMDSLGNEYSSSQIRATYAGLLMERGEYPKAENLLLTAMEVYRRIGMREQEKEGLQELAEIYERSGQLQKSIDTWKRYSSLKDSLMNDNILRHQKDLEALYENEKNENKIRALTNAGTLQNIYLSVSIAGCVLLLLFLFVLNNRIRLRKKTNEQLEKQNAIIEEKNKDITDSINYARRIQEAVLPAAAVLQKQFKDAFVFYRPRDIVSGDFWWCAEQNGSFLLAAADCTGHGVPGGFMSVMSAAFLSEIINEKGVTEPAEVLTLLRLKVISALRQAHEKKDDTSEVKDGMDIAMCSFSSGNKNLQLACANNPVWLIRDKEVKIFHPDKFPVGIHYDELMPFTPQQEELQAGDMIYLFSDGYADQFGGPEGKKFKYRSLKELLTEISMLPCEEQKRRIEKRFDEWKGNNEQVDDVLLVGIRI